MITTFLCASGMMRLDPAMLQQKTKGLRKVEKTREGNGYDAHNWGYWQSGTRSEIEQENTLRQQVINAGISQFTGLHHDAVGGTLIGQFDHTPVATLIRQDSKEFAYKHQARILAKGSKFTKENCPWVEIKGDLDRRLYASITITGCTSWKPLVERLHELEKRDKFLILSGRHGQLPNKYCKDTNLTDPHIFDKTLLAENSGDDFFKRDTKQRDQFMKSAVGTSTLENISIEVLDTARLYDHDLDFIQGVKNTDTRYNQLFHLRRVIEKAQYNGYVVVMAWCFSLHTFTQFDRSLEYDQKERDAKFANVEKTLMQKTVSETVDQDFQFAISPKSGNGFPTDKTSDRVNNLKDY